ncbi:MAG TPA: hypothetical protein VK867_13620 [Candidatus Limnocylindrales bacterium]|nr:hypothetical protein [Candidatus Limnocylindrales bacterium]
MSRGIRRLASLVAASVVAASVAAACLPAPRSTTATATPVGSAQPGATAKPSPTPKAFVAAIEKFTDRVTSGKLTYHIAFTGVVSASADQLPIIGSMDVAGADFASSFTYDFSRDYDGIGKVRVQVRGVKGKGFLKSGAAAWRAIKGFGAGQSNVPFKAVKAAQDVRYLGAVTTGGKTYHKIGVTGAVLIHPNTIPGMSQKEQVDDTQLEIVIDDAGRPRSGTWKLWGKSRVGEGQGQLQRIVYELDLTFSKVGGKIAIKRP